ncbi:MAG: DUF433 domain-containing protein [Candidatus Brocadia sp. AMX2]|uniref:Uncharacterized conserved protein n=1 Tax=Candidatus Brocadia sinica JPN1 TaxID=1197129 RepID=A0ABQ0JY34_9BACT|nr:MULTISPECIES: DUF433 domain-containing protein [Brocadia]MBC6931415.1 DUF433 domain-containing protein [Candidatus Brocadia sp.]MBL1167529.1 DUF433 domain-containing protein [Candidatus Brocadia sp. AMX1]NOG40582.1 DUF433 domain-containing protein [Planctomycetota bacterium]GIK13446.1 MAG: hypothetical protein BroJett002_21530 [Candidatus Brocadia sinica]KAA0244145.1 MAG: DUF433 domain-containing protein [Candidatus Brocadia sp. AMX2]
MKDYRNRITVNPKVHFVKPYIIGTRITVDNVLELIQEGIPFNETIQNYYPDLKIEDIKACIQYVLDLIRKEEIYMEVS